jgi:hypothetical protein
MLLAAAVGPTVKLAPGVGVVVGVGVDVGVVVGVADGVGGLLGSLLTVTAMVATPTVPLELL